MTAQHEGRADAEGWIRKPKGPFGPVPVVRTLETIFDQCAPEPNSGCLIWTGYVTDSGYAQIIHKGRKTRLHRLTYELANGEIPNGLRLDHKCRVRCCVNPYHLEAVTDKINILRGIGPTAINAKKVICKRGHPLSGKNLHIDKRGQRSCLECSRLHNIKSRSIYGRTDTLRGARRRLFQVIIQLPSVLTKNSGAIK